MTEKSSDGARLTGRLGALADGVVRLVVSMGHPGAYSVQEVALENVVKAVVQVEFSAPNARELELARQSGKDPDP